MPAAYIPNHADLMQGRLTSQFQSKPNLAAIVAAHGAQYQALEDAFRDIALYRPFGPSCATDPLSRWGAAVGRPRPASGPGALGDDATYYRQVQAQVLVNSSNGTANEVASLLAALGATGGVYSDSGPATATIYFAGALAVDDATAKSLAAQDVGPVSVQLVQYSAPPFGFAGNPIAAGFGVGKLARRL